MRFSAVITTILGAAAALVAAAPTPAEPLVARACQTASYSIARVEQAQPNTANLPGFVVAQDAGQTNRKDAFAQFNVPAGSYGCTLQAYFPAGYAISTTGTSEQSRVDVYAVTAPLASGLTWNTSPSPGSLVGTLNFASNPSSESTVTINSFVCSTALAYRFRIQSGSTAAASVSFTQTSYAGVRLIYNC